MPDLPNNRSCAGCLVCIDACKHKALQYLEATDGFRYIIKNESLCNSCGSCERVCPVISNSYGSNSAILESKPYTMWSQNEHLRYKSSSGGVFPEIARIILSKGGVVVGAVMKGTKTYHRIVENEKDLEALQGSKYLQSNTAGIYVSVDKYLKSGRLVLFTGTPCQVAGMLLYVAGKDYNKLLFTADLICHGVPSQKIFDRYIEREDKEVKEVISFRNKMDGSDIAMTLRMHDEEIKTSSIKEKDFFLLAFLNDMGLRLSCYKCHFAFANRKADITMGDYWGIKKHEKEKIGGISLVLVHSKRGEELLRGTGLIIENTEWSEALPFNPRIYNGYNIMRYTPQRLYMRFLANKCSYSTLYKLYVGTYKKDILWYPLKATNIMFAIINTLVRKVKLRNILKVAKHKMLHNNTKVMLLTFHKENNYGATLQTYALSKAIKIVGHDVTLIDFRLHPKIISLSEFKKRYLSLAVISRIKFLIFHKKYYPPLTKRYKDQASFDKYPPVADTFVVGSDQVWNTEITKECAKTYFLNFATDKAKKISYAASFGSEEWSDSYITVDEVRNMLNKFSAISIREETGVNICKNILDLHAEETLDPTLLHSDYNEIVGKIRNKNNLVCFKFNQDIIFYETALMIANIKKMNPILLNNVKPIRGFKCIGVPSVNKWLRSIAESSFVITDSFHGLAFSIIFNKDFIVLPSNPKRVTRIINLLTKLGIEDRYFENYDEIRASDRWKAPINYDKVNAILEGYRNISYEYLNKHLNNKL